MDTSTMVVNGVHYLFPCVLISASCLGFTCPGTTVHVPILFPIHPLFPYSVFIEAYINPKYPAIFPSFYMQLLHLPTPHPLLSIYPILSIYPLAFYYCYPIPISTTTQHLPYLVLVGTSIYLSQ